MSQQLTLNEKNLIVNLLLAAALESAALDHMDKIIDQGNPFVQKRKKALNDRKKTIENIITSLDVDIRDITEFVDGKEICDFNDIVEHILKESNSINIFV